MTLARLARLWFGFSERVDRRAYAASGFGLMAFKYATDAALVWVGTQRLWTPVDYLMPLLNVRTRVLEESASGWIAVLFLWVLFLWTLPFAWIGASMTFRRAHDAGLSIWTGLLFFVPFVNYAWMLLLCLLPSREPGVSARPLAEAGDPVARAAVLAAGAATLLGVALVTFATQGLELYGAMLFLGTPLAMGIVSSLRLNRAADRGAARSLAVALLALLFVGGVLLLFALEGVVCLVMAAPLAIVLAAFGAVLGWLLAGTHRLPPSHASALLLALPLLMGVEAAGPHAPLREVVSTVEIAVPPEQVWPRVVGFTELPPPHELVFALGIAYPMRARIEGTGVGAIRRCEFSTGAFVEPITLWDPPRRLAFDVASQPQPLHETSPYRVVHAPHLLDGLRSERGEFRLVALPGGRTRLEGRTWYRVEMAPQLYWGLYSDRLIHAIHQRVLAHVKALAESDAAAARAAR